MADPEQAARSTDSGGQEMNWRRALGISAAGAALVGVVTFLLLPLRYTSSVSLLLNDTPEVTATLSGLSAGAAAAAGGLSSAAAGLLGQDPTMERFQTILKSDAVAFRLVRKFGLARRWGESETEAAKELRRLTRLKLLGSQGLQVSVTAVGTSRVGTWLGWPAPIATREAPQLCAAMANEYTAALDEYVTSARVSQARATSEFLEKRQREVLAKLSELEDRLQLLQTRYQLLDPQSKAAALVDSAKSAAQAFAAAQADAEGAAHSLSLAQARLSATTVMRISEEMRVRNPVLEPLQQQIAETQASIAADLESGKAEAHPDVAEKRATLRSLEAQVRSIQQQVEAQVTTSANPAYDGLVAKVVELEVALAGARATRNTYGAALNDMQSQLRTLPPVARQYAVLARQRDLQADLLAILVKRLEQSTIEEQIESSGKFQILDAAQPPERKSGPSTAANMVIAFVLLGLGQVLLWVRQKGLFTLEELQ